MGSGVVGLGSGVGSRAGVGSGMSLGAEVGCARFAGTTVVGLGTDFPEVVAPNDGHLFFV